MLPSTPSLHINHSNEFSMCFNFQVLGRQCIIFNQIICFTSSELLQFKELSGFNKEYSSRMVQELLDHVSCIHSVAYDCYNVVCPRAKSFSIVFLLAVHNSWAEWFSDQEVLYIRISRSLLSKPS